VIWEDLRKGDGRFDRADNWRIRMSMVEVDVGFQGRLDGCLSTTRIEWDRSTAPACVASPRPGYVAATELFLSRDDGSSRGLLCSGPLVTEPRPLLRSMSRFPQSNQAFAEQINRPHNNTIRIFRGIVLPLNALAFFSFTALSRQK